MKIAYLLNTYPAPSSTFIRGEIEALEELGVAVTRFAVRRFDGPLVDPADISEAGITRYLLDGNKKGLLFAALKELAFNPIGLARALPAWLRLLRNARGGVVRHAAYLVQAAALRQECERLGIRHVHTHYSNNPTAVAMLSSILGGPSYSFTAHGPDEFVEPELLSFDDKIARSAFVVGISAYGRKLLTGLARPADAPKVQVVHCGIELGNFTVAPAIAEDNLTFVCVGRLCQAKGQVHIPAAVAALKGRFPGLRVVLVGDGDMRAEIEAEIEKHGVGREVVLHGWASNQEVRRLIASGRALLLPSYAEGLPIVIMESLALGRPVLSTTVAGIPELVDAECGWLVEPGNHDQLVAAMRTALEASPATLQKMGRHGRARVEERHDRRTLGRQLRTLFARTGAGKPDAKATGATAQALTDAAD